MSAGSTLRVLAYHRIATCRGDALRDRPELTVTPAQFEYQMRVVARRYTPVSLEQVRQAGKSGGALPARAVLITFDDAYANVGEIAWPIMRDLRLPGTVFVPTAYPELKESGFWWDRLRVLLSNTEQRRLVLQGVGDFNLVDDQDRLSTYRFLRGVVKDSTPERADDILQAVSDQLGQTAIATEMMDWDHMRALAAEGLSFAPHSHNHPILTRLEASQLAEELVRPMDILKQKLGRSPAAIAYPSGHYNREVVAAAKSAGYELGFTTELRHDRLHPDTCMTLGRVCLTAKFSPLAFRVALAPGGTQAAQTYRFVKGLVKRR